MAREAKASALGIFDAQTLHNWRLLVRHIHYECADDSRTTPEAVSGEIDSSGMLLPVGPI